MTHNDKLPENQLSKSVVDESSYYGEKAFQLNRIPEQSYAPAPEYLKGRVLHRLPWASYVDVNPTELQYPLYWDPASANDIEDYEQYSHITHKRRATLPSPASGTTILRGIIRLLSALVDYKCLGMFVVPVFTFITLLGILLWFFDVNDNGQSFPTDVVIFAISLCVFSVLARQVTKWLDKTADANFRKDGGWNKVGQFCRKTGMVTTMRGESPFYEFDPYVESNFSQSGRSCALKLIHRYPHRIMLEGNKLPLDFNMGEPGDDAEQYAAWDALCRYMDISQPLPDIPALEPVRLLDPTTRSFDEAGLRGKPPTYWLDLYATATKEELEALRTEHRKLVDSAPWAGRPDLMELSVPNFSGSGTGEPERVNATWQAPWVQGGRFVPRPAATEADIPVNNNELVKATTHHPQDSNKRPN